MEAPAAQGGDQLPRAVRSRERLGVVLAVAVTVAGLAVVLVLATRADLLVAFGDAPTHILIARRIFDNLEPGFYQVGVHWTPLFHLLELPFVWIDPIYRSGAPGAIVSAFASLVTTAYLYRLALLVGSGRWVAFWAAVLIGTSPSFLYVGLIPMFYATIMATATINIYYLTKWTITGSPRSLLAAALALSLTTLTHFDTWALVPLEIGVVLIAAQTRWRSRHHTRATAWVWLLAGSYGLFFFALLNVLISGNPLAFVGSASSGPEILTPLQGLPALRTYPLAAWLVTGPALAIAAGAGIVAYLWRFRRQPRYLVPLLLLYPFAFYTTQSLGTGSVILPAADLEDWTNLRYAVTILPAAAFFATAGLRRPLLVGIAVVAVLVGTAVMVKDGRVATWEDAQGEKVGEADGETLGRWLGRHAREGQILFPSLHRYTDRTELFSELPSRRFIYADDATSFRRARRGDRTDLRRLKLRWVVSFEGRTPVARRIARLTGARACAVPRLKTIPNLAIDDLARRCRPAAASSG